MRPKKYFVLGTAILALASMYHVARAQQQPVGRLVLRGGLLIDGTGSAPLEDPVVVIENGKIKSVGKERSTIQPNDTVIDTTGKTIIPGLVDSHVHYRNFLAPLFLYWGVTTVGDMANARGWIFSQKRAVAQGSMEGPFIMAVGNMINAPRKPSDAVGPGEFAGLRTFLNGNSYQTYVTDEASLEVAISEAKKLGADGIKLYTRMDPTLMKMAARIAHRLGLPVFSHFTSGNARAGLFLGTNEIMDTGIDVHVHTFGLIKAATAPDIQDQIAKGQHIEAMHLLDTSRFATLAQQMVANKMFLNPTLNEFVKTSRYREDLDRFNTAFLQGPLGGILPDDARLRFLDAYKPNQSEHAEELAEGYRRVGAFVKEFAERGGKVIAGADTGPGAAPAGISMHVEMRLLEEVGLTRMQVLQAATSWAMEAWGKSDEVGTIKPGKRADLVVLNRNPLDDMTATQDISQVIQAGKVVDRQALTRWKDKLPRPAPLQSGSPNATITIPFIKDIVPASLSLRMRNVTELIISGENFTSRSKVLLNEVLVPAKFIDETRLGVSVSGNMLKEAGTLPVVVVRPGSGGAVSNMNYIIVTSD